MSTDTGKKQTCIHKGEKTNEGQVKLISNPEGQESMFRQEGKHNMTQNERHYKIKQEMSELRYQNMTVTH